MRFVFSFAVLFLSLAAVGCDSNDAVGDESEIDEVAMLPEELTLQVGETADFDIVPLTAAGDTVRNVELDVEWWSTDTTVFVVTNEGLASGVAAGEAYCMAEVTELGKTSLLFTGRDSVFVRVRAF